MISLPPAPKDIGLEYESWRKGQKEIIEKIINCPKDIILLNAPTGVGKSLIASAIAHYLGKTIILTSSKQLQTQYICDFPHIKSIKGRGNYDCLNISGNKCDKCGNTPSTPCKQAGKCNYNVAKSKALNTPVCVMNNTYYLFLSNYTEDIWWFPYNNVLLKLDNILL
jgi:Rad3-related DNA helicase